MVLDFLRVNLCVGDQKDFGKVKVIKYVLFVCLDLCFQHPRKLYLMMEELFEFKFMLCLFYNFDLFNFSFILTLPFRIIKVISFLLLITIII